MSNKKHISKLYAKYEDDMQKDIKTPEASNLTREIISLTDAISKELTLEQQRQIEHISELKSEREALHQEQVFIFAFSLAIQLIADGLNKNILIEKIVET